METWVIVVMVIIVLAIIGSIAQSKEIATAHNNYRDSLARLKNAPTNADLKEGTLALGRKYANLMRKKKGQTIFDEVSLMNDINAACAASHVRSMPRTPAPAASPSVEDRLKTLMGLRDKGFIDAQEFAKQRAEILSSV